MKMILSGFMPVLVFCVATFLLLSKGETFAAKKAGIRHMFQTDTTIIPHETDMTVDTARFDSLNTQLANGDTTGRWPPFIPTPLPGAIFPFNRVVAFYGNLYSKNMGILGALPKDQMIAKLKKEVAAWRDADTTKKVIPALHYIAVTAQGSPGQDGKYRLRMPASQIEKVIGWSDEIGGLTFLDLQVGLSTVESEVPLLDKYLMLPTVHLGIDPEFSMKSGGLPGKRIGTYDAKDINWVIDHLTNLVRENNLPPKILVIHRFTQAMVTNYQDIKKVPEVQIVMDMDGWGPQRLKKDTWRAFIFKEPVEYAGFKIFYKNDTKTGANQLFTPKELMKFIPQPIYIQYQ